MVRRLFVVGCVVVLLVFSVGRATGAELVGEGKVFVRFTNTRQDDVGILVRLHVVPNSNKPFGWNGVTVYVGADCARETAEGPYLSPGEASPWIDVGQYMTLEGTRSWATYLSPLFCGVLTEPKADGLYVLAEVAQGPGTRVIRRVEVAKPELASESAVFRYRLWYEALAAKTQAALEEHPGKRVLAGAVLGLVHAMLAGLTLHAWLLWAVTISGCIVLFPTRAWLERPAGK